jgi:mRNA interferase MazF
VVLSPRSYNGKVGIAILCPISTKVKGYPFEVAIPAGLPVHGVVLSDHVKSLDWRVRQASLLCRLPESVVDEVLQKLNSLLGQEHRIRDADTV